MTAFSLKGFSQTTPQPYAAVPQYTTGNPAALNNDLTKIENQLYGHPYSDQPVGKRVQRLERTLFGSLQPGSYEARYVRIAERMKQQQKVGQSVTDDSAMIEFLEQRFFQQTYPQMNADQRLRKLETYVYGKTSEKDSLDARVKRLTYTVPLQAKEIRLTKEGRVLASTHPKRNKTINPMSAVQTTPDYFDSLFKLPNSKILRWMHLPVKVYVQSATAEQQELVGQAIQQWNGIYPIRLCTESVQADIVMDWKAIPRSSTQSPINTSGNLVRPMVQLGEGKMLRNVILVSMSPYQNHPKHMQYRAILHQLGHASGIWGHSDNPQDIMYPIDQMEATDIPERWNHGVLKFSSYIPEPSTGGPPAQPTERDRNTMVQVYSYPGEDLRFYSAK